MTSTLLTSLLVLLSSLCSVSMAQSGLQVSESYETSFVGSSKLHNADFLNEMKAKLNLVGTLYMSEPYALGFRMNGQKMQLVWIQAFDQASKVFVQAQGESFGASALPRLEAQLKKYVATQDEIFQSQVKPWLNLTRQMANFLALGEGHVSLTAAQKWTLVAVDVVTTPVQLLYWSVKQGLEYKKAMELHHQVIVEGNTAVRLQYDQLAQLQQVASAAIASITPGTCRHSSAAK
jgi:hypothetical protein